MARILIIEDDPAFRKMLCRYLGNAGHECLELDHGSTAVGKALEAVQSDGPFSLAIVDAWYLPGKKGTEVCQELRACPAFTRLPLLLFSVEGWDSVGGALGDSIKVEFMRKPVDLAEVVALVNRIVAAATGGPHE